MPRIDPLALLNCLSVLLGPSGGIKGTKEVDRLATLMTKFSKKLVSKCIYIQILKTTSTDLLNQFMSTGGWDLIHIWLTDAILAKNWALIQELLELLLLCPVDISRLKSNNNPKLIKGLSKEGSHTGVRILACRLVEQWLKIVKDSVPSPTDSTQQAMPPNHTILPSQHLGLKTEPEELKMPPEQMTETSTVQVQDLELTNVSCISPLELHSQQQQFRDTIHIHPVQLQIVNKTLPGQTQPTQIKKQSFVVVSTASSLNPPSGPVYKILIRDGKQVLTKVETGGAATNVPNAYTDSPKNVENTDNVDKSKDIVMTSECDDGTINTRTLEGDGELTSEVNHMSTISFKQDNVDVKDVKDGSDSSNKSNDKENRDSPKKDDKASLEKKSHHSSSKSSSSRHSSSSRSSSHKSSSHHRSSSSGSKSSSSSSKSSRDKDRHSSSRHSSSSKGKSEREKEREKEKEKLKKDQAEKDKATLEKVQGQSLSTKFGKIPKKKAEEEKSDNSVRKSSTDSRDSSKENKDKTDPKKLEVQGVLEKKNISISIENRKNSQETSRPKTVKTFNSKFRSTGLEEEVKPPPPRSAAKKPASSSNNEKKVVLLPPKVPLKRSSPLRESAVSDKRAKLSLDATVPTLGEDKKGAIKLIPPKPKPMILQESDMFMDALTASTKSKEPRKRKRRSSLSKDDKTDSKKSDGNSLSDNAKETTSPPSSSPTGADERSPLSIKPEFKFYQDTLETDEDKEDKDKLSPDDEKEENEAKEKDSFEDDEGSRTPTNDEEIDDMKAPASPDDSDDGQKELSSPNSEIRYVDGLRSVLLLQKRKGPKKNLKWKEELESVRYFELDETERVNVTKTFTDAKQMEKQGEREAFEMARKLNTADVMEEKTRWKALISIDLPSPLVEPGKESREKDIQYAREQGILQALYFNRGMIPDSAAEPDEERHHVMIDPKIIPLDDLTGNKESEKDFTMIPWPEPKPSLGSITPIISNVCHHQSFSQNHGMVIPQGLPVNAIGLGMCQPMAPGIIPINHIVPGEVGGGGWRTGDGKVVVPDVNMTNIGNITGFPPPNMMPPPGICNHQVPSGPHHPGQPHQPPEGYPVPGMMGMEDGSFVGHMPNNFQGPGPGLFGPGPNFQGPPPRPGMRGRGGPGWFRCGMGPMRGGWPARGNWRGGGKQPPVCRQFTKNGFCRVGDKCQYLHPGVNCPPF